MWSRFLNLTTRVRLKRSGRYDTFGHHILASTDAMQAAEKIISCGVEGAVEIQKGITHDECHSRILGMVSNDKLEAENGVCFKGAAHDL